MIHKLHHYTYQLALDFVIMWASVHMATAKVAMQLILDASDGCVSCWDSTFENVHLHVTCRATGSVQIWFV